MNKKKFLSDLEQALVALPRKDRKKTLDFYRELIDDKLEEGLTETDILGELGTPEDISTQVLSELPQREGTSWGVILLLVLGFPLWFPLLITAAVLLLTVLIVVFAVELVLAACGIADVLGGLVLLVLWKPYAALALIGPGLVCLGLAIPLWFLCVLTTKAFWRLTVKTCRSIFRKG